MSLSNAERQAKYRASRLRGESDEFRINTWLSCNAYFALKRLSRHRASSRKAVLESLLIAADKKLSRGLTDEEFERYFET